MEQFISLMLKDTVIEDLRKLSEKLDLSRSATVRLAVERMIEQYVGSEADIIVVDRGKFDRIIKMLSKRLTQEISKEILQEAVKQVQESPKMRKLYELAQKGKLEIVEKKQ